MMKHQTGFTLIELMIVLTVAGIIASIALPNIRYGILNNQITAKTNEFVTVLNYARSQAITKNRAIEIVPINGDWAEGWLVQWTFPPDGEDSEVIREFTSTASNIAISSIQPAATTKISYNSAGGVNDNPIDFAVCTASGLESDPPGRSLRINSPTGRVSIMNRKYKCLGGSN